MKYRGWYEGGGNPTWIERTENILEKNNSNSDIPWFEVSEQSFPTPPPPHTPSSKENSDNEEVFYKQNISSFHKILIPLVIFNPIRLARRMDPILSAVGDRKPTSNGLGIMGMQHLTELEVQKQG